MRTRQHRRRTPPPPLHPSDRFRLGSSGFFGLVTEIYCFVTSIIILIMEWNGRIRVKVKSFRKYVSIMKVISGHPHTSPATEIRKALPYKEQKTGTNIIFCHDTLNSHFFS